MGQSYVAGDGVSDGETFEALLEDRLNAGGAAEPGVSGFEILNFGVGSYSLLQQLVLLERALSFEPNAVYLVVTPTDAERLLIHLIQQVRRGVEIPFPDVREVVDSVGVDAGMRETEAMRRLGPFGDDLVAWTLEEFARVCRDRGVTPVWVYLYVPQEDSFDHDYVRGLEGTARAAGFVTLDLFDVYDGYDLTELRVSEADRHPNELGHRVIAERLYEELLANGEALGLPLGPVIDRD